MKRDHHKLLGYNVTFLNPPSQRFPNVTFMVEIPSGENVLDIMHVWKADKTIIKIEIEFNLVILGCKTWFIADNDGISSMVIVNYYVMSTENYYRYLNGNAIRRYPAGSSSIMCSLYETKYMYTTDFIHRYNRHNPFIMNGYVDVMLSFVFLPETEEQTIDAVVSDIIPTIRDDIFVHMVPEEFRSCMDIHVVGYNPASMCFEFTFSLQYILHESGEDIQTLRVDTISKQFISFDKKILEHTDSFKTMKVLTRSTLMDEKGFWEIPDWNLCSQRKITTAVEGMDNGDDIITIIPTIVRYELEIETLLYERESIEQSTIYYGRSKKQIKYPDVQLWQMSCQDPHMMNNNHPVAIAKVPLELCLSRSTVYDIFPVINGDVELFAATLTDKWYAWYVK